MTGRSWFITHGVIIAPALGAGGRHAQSVTTQTINMDYTVYILYSQTRSRYYVGQTSNIENRLKKHNQGNVKSTKYGIPWKLVLQIEVKTRFEVIVLESKIKKRGAKRYLDDHFGV